MKGGVVLGAVCAQWEPRVGPPPRQVIGHSFEINAHMHSILAYLVKDTLKQ